MRVTAKGRMTISIAIRRTPGLVPGCEVGFELSGDAVVIRETGTHDRGPALVRSLRGRTAVATSSDAMLALTRSPGR